MSQLLSGRQKGRFGAPPEPTKRSSPWRVVPLYILVPLTAVCLAVSSPAWLGYYACGERHEVGCQSGGVLQVAQTGTLNGIIVATGLMLAVAVACVLLSVLLVRRWNLVVVYGLAVVALGLAIYAFLALSGSVPTPGGMLGPGSAR